jgi:UDP-glucose 4-epimerase
MESSGRPSLIIGANGFLGSHLVDALPRDGSPVRAFDRFSAGRRFEAKDVECVRGDVMNTADVARAVEGCADVFHFVSASTPATSAGDPTFDLRANVIPTVELLRHCAEAGVERVFFASSGGTVYGDSGGQRSRETDPLRPVSPYGIGKVTIEHYLDYFATQTGLQSVVLRISNPYGTRQSAKRAQGLIGIALRDVRDYGRVRRFGDGEMVRDYLHAEDLTEMIVALQAGQPEHHVYNLGSGKGHSVNEVIAVIRDVTGVDFDIENIAQPPTYVQSTVLDLERFTDEFGAPRLRSLEDGIAEMWQEIGQ